jgi:hypothetical protein
LERKEQIEETGSGRGRIGERKGSVGTAGAWLRRETWWHQRGFWIQTEGTDFEKKNPPPKRPSRRRSQFGFFLKSRGFSERHIARSLW